MPVKKITLAFLGILLSQIAFSQKNYIPGYILTLNGDTTRGFIDFRGWESNPDKISFKTNSDEKIIYDPMEIKGFSVQGEIYKSAIVKTEIGQHSNLEFKDETVFLRAIITGIKSLYFYKNKSQGTERFYIKNDSIYELLIYKRYQTEQANGNVIVENKKYIGQLLVYFTDCPGIQKKINGSNYNRRSLQNLFLSYYECTHSAFEFKKEEKVETEFGFVTGLSLTSLKFKGVPMYFGLLNADYKVSTNFTFGLSLNIILEGNQKNLSIYNELLYTTFNTSATSQHTTPNGNYDVTRSSIDHTVLKLNNLIRYKFPLKKAFFILNGGLSTGFLTSSTSYVVDGKPMDDLNKFELGFVTGIGTQFNKVSFETRFEWSSGFSPYPGLDEKITRFYFLMGYRFE